MPLSKAKQAEYQRQKRRGVIPNSKIVIPNINRHLASHIKAYPDGFNPDGTYKKDYNPRLDPYINPMMRQAQLQPNYPAGTLCPDGRVRLPDMSLVQPEQCEVIKLFKRR